MLVTLGNCWTLWFPLDTRSLGHLELGAAVAAASAAYQGGASRACSTVALRVLPLHMQTLLSLLEVL